jgi:hypothetical protein
MCDWWCSHFDTTDGYLRFILTDGQMTVPFFSGCNLSKTKTCFPPEQKTDTTAQLEKKFLQPTHSKSICSSVRNSVRQ